MTPRVMGRDDLATALDWARAEGWNPGTTDAGHFLGADPAGFLMLDDPQGIPGASVSIVRVGPDRYFLGLFIVRPDLRGQGYARPLWQAAMDLAGHAPVGLDGVVAEQPRYAARGFRPAHRTRRHAGIVASGQGQGGSRAVTPGDIDAVAALDGAATGFGRTPFIGRWMTPAAGRASLVLDGPDGLLAAGTIRRCHEGWKIGPALARNERAGHGLLADLADVAGGERIMIDIPEDAPDAAARAGHLGLEPVSETMRMWRGAPPDRTPGLEWGGATLELG